MLVAAAIALAAAAGSFAGHDSHIGQADAGHLAAALAVGILASVVPFLLYNAAIARVTATAAGLTLSLVPLFGTLASLLLLGGSLGDVLGPGRAILVLALVPLAALALAQTASAAAAVGPGRPTFFRTPSGNIRCAFFGPSPASVRCDITKTDNAPRPRPASCEFDYGMSYGMRARSRAHRLCVSDSVAGPHARVLRYGHSISRHGIRCSSRKAHLRCVNRRHHGFTLSRAAQTLF
jgi:hypothetical protein